MKYPKSGYSRHDKFVEKLSFIRSISFTGLPSLFSKKGDLFQNISNIFSFGDPVAYELSIKFEKPITEKIKERMSCLFRMKQDRELRSLVCIGKDNENIETVFDPDGFSKKIEIMAEKNDEHLFSEREVKSVLIQKIIEEEEKNHV